jgi:hypothetical protein
MHFSMKNYLKSIRNHTVKHAINILTRVTRINLIGCEKYDAVGAMRFKNQ